MRRLPSYVRARVINCLIEGCSIRATVRMTGVAKKTVIRLLVEVGEVCADYQDRTFRGLSCVVCNWMNCGLGFTASRRTAPKKSRERIRTRVMYGSGFAWTRILSWFLRGVLASVIS